MSNIKESVGLEFYETSPWCVESHLLPTRYMTLSPCVYMPGFYMPKYLPWLKRPVTLDEHLG